MSIKTAALAMAVGLSLLACKKQDDAAAADSGATTAPSAAATADAAPQPAPVAPAPAAVTPAPAATSFDINTIAVSDKPLGGWPYITMPADYALGHADELASRSKDLARVPVWTGGQLLWVEGRVFSDSIRAQEGKTHSRFELRKNLQQAIEALGGVRLAERNFDSAVQEANAKELDDFRGEFGDMHDAYWHDNDADFYVIRRADKAIWVVTQADNSDGAIMVVEGPLPEAPPAS